MQRRNSKAASNRLSRRGYCTCLLLTALAYVLLLCWAAIEAFEDRVIPESWQVYSWTKLKLNMKLLEHRRAWMPTCQTHSGQQDNSKSGKCSFPRVFMLRGRSPEEVRQDVVHSWAPFNPLNLPAREKSREMVDVPGCEESTWGNRLFAVYLEFFREILRDYPSEESFVFVEDDAVLLDAHAFRTSVCDQQQIVGVDTEQHSMNNSFVTGWRGGLSGNRMHFFSFFRDKEMDTPKEDCSYHYGTQAFLVNREMMQHLISLTAFNRCRIPIDLHLVRTPCPDLSPNV